MMLQGQPTTSGLARLDKRSDTSGVRARCDGVGHRSEASIAFGPFRLYPERRLLLEQDEPLRLGSRALDILIALVKRPGEVISKRELMGQIWPGIVVEEGNLKVQVAALRRMLHDGQSGNRYISTVSGRGYCFVAPVMRTDLPPLTPSDAVDGLTASLTSVVSSRDLAEMLEAQPAHRHFMVVVGAENMAKGAILAESLKWEYQHGVFVIDLAPINDPRQVPATVAAAIGLGGGSDPMAAVTGFLEDKHALLLLDNCRHVIGAAAAFAVNALACAPRVQILAIGR